MPLQQTSGAASYDAFGGGVPFEPIYIEQVFQNWLYTGNGSTQTINNGVDLSGKGGMVWCKIRNTGDAHALFDTARGFPNWLASNTTGAQNAFGTPDSTDMVATSTGFSMNNISSASNTWNSSGNTFASWTFREQPKFFDVVTWTGTGSARTVAHNLGSTPGCIIVKNTTAASSWTVYHQKLNNGTIPQNYFIELDGTGVEDTNSSVWNNTAPTSTAFTVGSSSSVNDSGQTYVAYLFASNAGGFGLSGTDNVIACGNYDGNGSANGPEVTLDFEPQWLLIRRVSGGAAAAVIVDTMRGSSLTGGNGLYPSYSSAENGEGATQSFVYPTATGFKVGSSGAYINSSSSKYIYIAIRRGPMRTPTTGTSVFDADTLIPAANLTGTKVTNPFAMDFLLTAQRDRSGLASTFAADRLRGGSQTLFTNATSAETNLGSTYNYKLDFNDGFVDNVAYPNGTVTTPMIYWSFRRAPGFFDEVCYTGNGATTTQPHNLAAVPELIIVKRRTGTGGWPVYSATYGRDFYAFLNITQGFASDPGNSWGTTNPTSTTFGLSPLDDTNSSGVTYVAYLFASCPGVSKVGSYTGTATTLQINCGFTAGARFVLIKRTDSTGDWYVWDSARGIVAGNDPYLLLNSASAEVTNTDFIDTASTGFEISSTAPAAINASGGTFIFLAIA